MASEEQEPQSAAPATEEVPGDGSRGVEESASGGHGDAEHLGVGVGAILGGLVGGRVLRLLARVAVARFLGAASLGIFDLAWTVAYLLAFNTVVGLPTGVVRFGAALWRQDRGAFRELVRFSIGVTLLLSTVAAALLALLAEPLADGVFGQPEVAWAFRVAALLVPLSAGLEMFTAVTRATQRMRHTALIRDLLGPAVQFIAFLVLLALGYGVAAALWAAVLGFLVAFLAAAWVVRRMIVGAGAAVGPSVRAREVMAYSLPVAMSGLIGVFLVMVDRLIVGALRTPAELGVYSAAAQLAIMSGLIASAFTTTLTPRFADLMDRREPGRLADLLQVSTRWGIYLAGPLAVVLVLAPRPTLVGIFGAEFASGAAVLLVLMLGQLAMVGTGACSVVLMTGGLERRWLLFNTAALVVNVVLDLILIPRYGIVGAAWGSALALLLRHGAALVSTRRRFGVWPYDRRSLKLLPALLASAGGVLAVGRLVDLPAIWTLALCMVVSWLAMTGTLALLGLEPEDRSTLATLLGRLGLGSRGG